MQSDRHIRIAGKIAIDLQGITIHTQQIFHPCIEQRSIEYAVDDVQADIVGYDGFLKEPTRREKALSELRPRNSRSLINLRNKIACPNDWVTPPAAEEGDIENIVDPTPEGAIYPVHINHVADGLEGKEGNADRQKYIQRLIGNVLRRYSLTELPQLMSNGMQDSP